MEKQTFLGALGNAAIGGLTSGLSGGIASGISGLLSSFTGGLTARRNYKYQKKLMKQQDEYNRQYMALQNEYQQAAAAKEQEYAKEMWDYTNVENQIKHLEAAGLNPALIYGMNGGGGAGNASTAGAHVTGNVSPVGNPVEMGLRSQELELQRRAQEAQINMMNAQASKSMAEAEKTSGVDTEEGWSRIELNNAKMKEANENASKLAKEGKYLEAMTVYTGSLKDQADANTDLIKQNEKLSFEQTKTEQQKANNAILDGINLYHEARKKKVDADVAEATLKEQIDSYFLTNACLIAQRYRDTTQGQVNEQMVQKLATDMKAAMINAAAHGLSAYSFTRQVEGQLERWSEQTFNERWHNINESAGTILDGISTVSHAIFKIPNVGNFIKVFNKQ